MTVSAEAVDTGGVSPGDRVLVLGPGNIGQGIALFASAAGAAEVVIVGKDDAPRLECLRRMGFPATVDVGERALEEALAPYLADGRFDVVIEATGVPAIVQQGLDVLRKRGVLVVCGIHPRPGQRRPHAAGARAAADPGLVSRAAADLDAGPRLPEPSNAELARR